MKIKHLLYLVLSLCTMMSVSMAVTSCGDEEKKDLENAFGINDDSNNKDNSEKVIFNISDLDSTAWMQTNGTDTTIYVFKGKNIGEKYISQRSKKNSYDFEYEYNSFKILTLYFNNGDKEEYSIADYVKDRKLVLQDSFGNKYSYTACQIPEVVADTLNVDLRLYQWQFEGTAWYTGDNSYMLVLAFDSNSQGRMYEIQNNEYTSAQYVSWSYNQENNTLTIGGQTYNVTAFTAGQSLTMNINGKEYTFNAVDPSSLASVEEVNGQGSGQSQDVSGYFAGTAWAIGAGNGKAYLYYFETATKGTIYLCDLDSSGNLTPTDQSIDFTYQFGKTKDGGYAFVIQYGDTTEVWYYVDMAEDGSTLTIKMDDSEYTFTQISVNSRMNSKYSKGGRMKSKFSQGNIMKFKF